MAARGLTDVYARSQRCTAPEGECGYINKTLSTSVLQHLCNTFNSCVLHCLQLARHNNVASKVLHGNKTLPYWYHLSKAQ